MSIWFYYDNIVTFQEIKYTNIVICKNKLMEAS